MLTKLTDVWVRGNAIFKLKWTAALFCVAMHFEERTWIKEHSKLYFNPTINAFLRHCLQQKHGV